MFNNCFPLGPSPIIDGIDKNVRLDSFLVHTRNLTDFLENKRKYEDDIVISDFTDISGNPIESVNLSLSSDIKKKIDKHVSHLTRARLGEKIEWNIAIIQRSINEGFLKFLDKVSDNHFPTKAKRKKDYFSNLIKQNPPFNFITS